jgi:small conductance mechanosensitive channel
VSRRRRPWFDVEAARQLSRRAVRRARLELLVVLPALAGVLLVFTYRDELFGEAADRLVRAATAVALLVLGWTTARDVGRSLRPVLFGRLDRAVAGTVEFVIRLVTMLVAVAIALHVAAVDPRTLALGGAVTAVVVGLAAQQTLANVIAGTVLFGARPFRVGDRVRMQGGPLAGSIEGVISSLGLMYTMLSSGDNAMLVPNSVVLNVAVIPLREPTAVELRARLRPGITPRDVQEHVASSVTVPLRGPPRVTLEEIDDDEVIVGVAATPKDPRDGSTLAAEVLEAVVPLTGRPPPRDTADNDT